jgi:hypothetical protein
MLFNLEVQAVGFSVEPSEVGLSISVATGLAMGPGQMLPMGNISFPMAKEDARKLAEAIIAAAESAPDNKKSDLLVTNQMPNRDLTDLEKKLRG